MSVASMGFRLNGPELSLIHGSQADAMATRPPARTRRPAIGFAPYCGAAWGAAPYCAGGGGGGGAICDQTGPAGAPHVSQNLS